jgi:hypothetical protein
MGSSNGLSSSEQSIFEEICKEIGWFKMVNQANVVEFTNIVAYHYTLVQNRAYLDDFIDGLRSLDVVQLIQAYPGMYGKID